VAKSQTRADILNEPDTGRSVNLKLETLPWLPLLGGVEQRVRSTAAIFWPIVRPHLSSNTPDSPTSGVCTYYIHCPE
jgi:hypothetical protein